MIDDHVTTMRVATRVDYSFLLTGRHGRERTSLPTCCRAMSARVKLRIVKLLLLNIMVACNDLLDYHL